MLARGLCRKLPLRCNDKLLRRSVVAGQLIKTLLGKPKLKYIFLGKLVLPTDELNLLLQPHALP